MTDRTHTGLPVAGYQKQSETAVTLVNTNKFKEEKILRDIDALLNGQTPDGESFQADPRWLAIARTNIEQGFMALNRAIFKPERISGEIGES